MFTSYTRKTPQCLLLAFVAMFCITGCSTFPKDDIKFESMPAPKVKLSDYKTFAWLVSAVVVNDPHGYWHPKDFDAEAEVKFALNKGLRDKGFLEVSDKPDFVVLYATGINMEWLEFKKDNELGKDIVTNVPKAALSVILIDTETEKPIWLGTATGNIQPDMDNELAKKRIHYAVEGILKTLPKSE